MIPRGTTFKFEYLGEFELEIKNILGHESGVAMGLIQEKPEAKSMSWPKLWHLTDINLCTLENEDT
jgi:hypothetical protein